MLRTARDRAHRVGTSIRPRRWKYRPGGEVLEVALGPFGHGRIERQSVRSSRSRALACAKSRGHGHRHAE